MISVWFGQISECFSLWLVRWLVRVGVWRKARRKERARETKESVQAAMALDPTWPELSVAHSSRRCDPFPAVVSCAPRRYILASPLL